MRAVPRRYVALLRAISNVRMQPFREALEELGFTDVDSYGMSGNLLFNARQSDLAAFERRIAARLGTPAVVRTRTHLARTVAQDPFHSVVLFLTGSPTPAQRRAFLRLAFLDPRPVLHGRTLFYVYPVRVLGRKGPLDLERALGVRGTFRSARVVRQILARMRGDS